MNLLEVVLKFGEKHFVRKDFKNDTVLDMFLHQIHPKQIVLRLDKKPFMFFEIKYSYTTIRGNKKQGKKYFVFNTYSPELNLSEELLHWVDEVNKENPKRQLLNVKILRSRCLGYATICA